jgi:hypothetical protein
LLPEALAVERRTFPPEQKLVEPCAVIAGLGPLPTETVIGLDVAEHPLLVTVRV